MKNVPFFGSFRFDNPHKGYYPLADSDQREKWHLPPMDIDLKIVQMSQRFDFDLKTQGGYDGILFVIEMFFPDGGSVQTEEVAFTPAAGGNLWLRSGKLTYRMGRHAIHVGPGKDVHRLAHTHSAGAVAGCFRVAIALTTPVSKSLEIRYGRWSEASRSIEVASLEIVETATATDATPTAPSFVRI